MTEASATELMQKIHNLEEENEKLRREKAKLSETVSWMHDMIWDLIRKNKSCGAA